MTVRTRGLLAGVLALLVPSGLCAEHWAFRPVVAPAVPGVRQGSWVRSPVDAFVLARLEAAGQVPAPEADRRTLLRRLYLDLLGLPPSPAEVEAFVADPSPRAYEDRVERALASPAYGERWGRHWLDVARWAESEGYESNHPRPYAWRYRDYVVNSFNADKPLARFIREQVAGDELAPYTDENLVATGFLAAARLSSNEEDKARQRNDVLVDVANATASAFLGLTLHCAQCHSHKFDPVTLKDYYRFLGFFVRGQPANLVLHDPQLWGPYLRARPPEYEPARQLVQVLYDGAHARLREQVRATLPAAMLRALTLPPERRNDVEERLAREAELQLQFSSTRIEKALRDEDRPLYEALKKKLEAIEKTIPDRPQTFGFYAPGTSPRAVETLPMKGFYPLPYDPDSLARARSFVLQGGDVHRRGAAVEPGWPAAFGPVADPERLALTPRTALAEWLADPRNPLTYRVWVNRVWQYHFGRGLVATPNDFGTQGAAPTHPELLDWLATEFVRQGGSTKALHRLIVGSSAYRQSAHGDPRGTQQDPDNRLWGRWTPRRLEAETIRDSLLAVSGELDRRLGGPSTPDDGQGRRRTLYLVQKREAPPMVQAFFDGPSGVTESCALRHVSTVPLQPLYLLNHPFGLARAKALAARVRAADVGQASSLTDRVSGKMPDPHLAAVDAAFRLALGRPPDDVERAAAGRFFARHGGAEALEHFCQALLNLNEFLYLE